MKSFLVLLISCAVFSVSASPVFTAPMKRIQRTGSYLERVSNADRARAATLRLRADDQPYTVPVTSVNYMEYVIKVGIGQPPEFYNLLVDTGSAITFCGTSAPYVRTPTSIPTIENVDVTYMIGYIGGIVYLDQVTLAPNLVIANQSIGAALSFDGFDTVDGILGLGRVGLTRGELSPNSDATLPTIMNNLAGQRLIKDQIVGIYFAPQTQDNETNGAVTFGGTDSSLYKGELKWIPTTNALPAGDWGVDATCTYGNFPVIPNPTAGIVDTGTTLIGLANDFFFAYKYGIPGAEMNDTIGFLEIPASAIPFMQPLNFMMGGQVFTLNVAAQLYYSPDSGEPNIWYGTVAPLGSNSGAGFDFILGMKFLERYYSAFDTDNDRIGFAPTVHTFSSQQS